LIPGVLPERIQISENLRFENVKELFDFSETLIGDVYLFNKKLRQKFLVNNFIISHQRGFVVLSQYIKPGPAKVLGIFNTEVNHPTFRIFICDLKNQEFYEQKSSMKALFIKRVFNNKILYYKAFHDNMEEFKRITRINDSNFKRISKNQVFE
jgi:hypothetical protein